jgi:O-acetyl-ADP-ribose deacetylase (regulator of RNase III)
MFGLSAARTGSRQQLKVRTSRLMASKQHSDWVKQLDASEFAMKDIWKVDPAVRTMKDRVNLLFRGDTIHNVPKTEKRMNQPTLEELEEIVRPKSKGIINEISLGSFGSIAFYHGNIFEVDAGALILPIPPNLHPHRGLALEALETGGEDFVRQIFSRVRADFAEDLATSPHGLPIGSIIQVSMKNKNCYLVVLPFFWQGTTTDAARRFRFAIRSVLKKVTKGPAESVALPHLGRGIFGFDAPWASVILAEEAVECGLFEVDDISARNRLKNIIFCDEKSEILAKIESAVEERVDQSEPVPAREYWKCRESRMMVLHEIAETRKARKSEKVKFKKHSGIIRSLKLFYQRSVKRQIWRAAKTHPVPVLLVDKKTGELASRQLSPKPFYRRHVSHTLFPVKARTGFTGLRKTSLGGWAPRPIKPHRDIQETVNPKL